MAIPLKYNLRNLIVRRTTTIMTALSITLTVAVFVVLMALAQGLETSLSSTGQPLDLLVFREGSQAETDSFVTHDNALQVLPYLHGIATNAKGQPMTSPELVVLINLPRLGETQGANVTIRGLEPQGFDLHPEFRLVEGRLFRPGLREVIASRRIASRFQDCALGDKLHFAKGYWTVVGIFAAGNTAYNSEIWTDENDLSQDFDRPDFSDVRIRAVDSSAVTQLKQQIANDPRLHLKSETEQEYYNRQMSTAAPIKVFGVFIAVLMSIGASFAAMNTMYAAVARRTREIGTLRAVGFSRRSILTSFVIESVLIAALGGVLGCTLALPVNWITTGTSNFVTFSEITFNFLVTPSLFVTGVIFSVLMGVFGGLFPAWRAAHENIVAALRSN